MTPQIAASLILFECYGFSVPISAGYIQEKMTEALGARSMPRSLEVLNTRTVALYP